MIEAYNLSVAYGQKTILHDINLTVEEGEVVALLGPNGAGKSTLLGALSGAVKPAAGDIRIDGVNPARLKPAELAMRRAVLEQTASTTASFSLQELVRLAMPRAISSAQADEITRQSLAAVGLENFANRRLTAMSGGERDRSHMARTLAQLMAGRALGHGRWLMLDEPTASLDLGHQGAVMRAARQVAENGAGVLAVLHDLTLAAAVADRIALLEKGQLVMIGTPQDVLRPEILAPVYGIDIAISHPAPGATAVTPLFATSGACSYFH